MLFRSDGGGPANIGRIVAMHHKKGSPTLTVQWLGRMAEIVPSARSMLVDEVSPRVIEILCAHRFICSPSPQRELFTTSEQTVVNATDLLKRCVVLHQSSVPSSAGDLDSWLALSPLHFYVRQHCSSSTRSLEALTKIKRHNVPVCQICYQEDATRLRQLKQFTSSEDRCLRAFDPFAGVGAFGLGMEKTGCIKVTHAVEISPSAAETLKYVSSYYMRGSVAPSWLADHISWRAGRTHRPQSCTISARTSCFSMQSRPTSAWPWTSIRWTSMRSAGFRHHLSPGR